ncbi:hypothetical protein [Botrimarina hoheduenensis]|uniref:Lipocalin-like domain-containing protein n=1 Tax=Botrimarina hoheduenensis TaxID=2528000 RepID=A0A5C5VYC2_9BACT|nr:hypothetical protein [Botrimarina hoheduenensis]TWT42729.1 hypothetical protein Pla111_27020 [Botrimarina hoheduenensis]
MRRPALLCCTVVCLLQVAPCGAVDLEAVRRQCLGTWEIESNNNGVRQRNVKEVDEDHETVTIYLDDVVSMKWRCEWQLEAVGEFVLYKFGNFESLEGGRVFPPSYAGQYLLKVTDDAWYEMVRLEADAIGPPRFDAFRRVTTGANRPVRPSNSRVAPLAPTAQFVPGKATRLWPSSNAEPFQINRSDDQRKAELEQLALGTWRCERPDGTVIEKLVEPGVEAVRLSRDGKTVRIWKTDWEIRVAGGVATFWFNNYQLLEGERSAPDGISGGYALSLVDGTWTEVTGMIGTAPSPPALNVFRRFEGQAAAASSP